MKKIILAAGGTGGHVFPAFAVAHILREQRHNVRWATDDRGLKYAGHWQGAAPIIVPSASPASKFKFIFCNGAGVLQCLWSFIMDRPDIVVGFGGYPSVPPVLAAQILGIPTIIHEANATLGLANRMLAAGARYVATSFTSEHPKAVVTGNPVRPAIAALHDQQSAAHNDTLRILIFGGSLGARIFTDLMPKLLQAMTADFRARLYIVQQVVDEAARQDLAARYSAMGVSCALVPFIDDMEAQLQQADLVIARSGATTIAELTCAGKPAILIPYPHHADRQQYANAAQCMAAGGAIMLDEKGGIDMIAQTVQVFLASRPDLMAMGRAMKSLSKPRAAWDLATLVKSAAA